MELKLKPLSPKLGKEIPLPSYATAGSAGMDLRACIDESFYLPGQVQMKYGTWAPRLVPTGLAKATPYLVASPERAKTKATYSGPGRAMARPVGTRRGAQVPYFICTCPGR